MTAKEADLEKVVFDHVGTKVEVHAHANHDGVHVVDE